MNDQLKPAARIFRAAGFSLCNFANTFFRHSFKIALY